MHLSMIRPPPPHPHPPTWGGVGHTLPHGWGTSRVNFPPTTMGTANFPHVSPHHDPSPWIYFVYRAIGELLNWFASLLLLVPYCSGHFHDLYSAAPRLNFDPQAQSTFIITMPHNAPPMGLKWPVNPPPFPPYGPQVGGGGGGGGGDRCISEDYNSCTN